VDKKTDSNVPTKNAHIITKRVTGKMNAEIIPMNQMKSVQVSPSTTKCILNLRILIIINFILVSLSLTQRLQWR